MGLALSSVNPVLPARRTLFPKGVLHEEIASAINGDKVPLELALHAANITKPVREEVLAKASKVDGERSKMKKSVKWTTGLGFIFAVPLFQLINYPEWSQSGQPYSGFLYLSMGVSAIAASVCLIVAMAFNKLNEQIWARDISRMISPQDRSASACARPDDRIQPSGMTKAVLSE